MSSYLTTFLNISLLILLTSSAEVSRQNEFGRQARGKSGKVSRQRSQGLEDYFNVYDSSFLSVVWPKLRPSVHLSVSTACWENMSVLFKQYRDGRLWSYNVVDASGRYRSGVFEGNRFWIGSKQECSLMNSKFHALFNKIRASRIHTFNMTNNGKSFEIGPEDDGQTLNQDSELVQLTEDIPPYPLSYSSVRIDINITKPNINRNYDVTLGVCLPKSCTAADVQSILNFSVMLTDYLKANKTVPRQVKISSVRKVDDSYNIKADTTALVLIFFTLSLVFISLLATAVDYKLINLKPRIPRTMSFNIQVVDPENEIKKTVYKHRERKVKKMPIHTINIKTLERLREIPPPIDLHAIDMDEKSSPNCKRCGRYKKQCTNFRPMNYETRTCYDYFVSQQTKDLGCKRNEFFKNILLSFSLRYSWVRICYVNLTNKELSIIHGLKVISTFWIMYLHVTTAVYYLSENGGDVDKYSVPYNVLMTGTFAFDTLFFVSGVLSSHHYFYLESRYSVEELVSCGGRCGRVMQYVCFVTNRAVRLLPSYAYVIFVSSVMSRAAEHTAPLTLPDSDARNCDSYWWRNLLYINNFYSNDERCLPISWYLSWESQLHALGMLLASAGGRAGAAGGAGALLLAAGGDVASGVAARGLGWSDTYSMYALVVERRLSKVSPYFMGLLIGWTLHKMNGTLHISKCKSWLLWSWSILCISVLALSRHLPPLGVWDVPLNTLAHMVWPVALSWPVIVLATSWKGMSRRVFGNRLVSCLSRLSYGALLLHAALARHALLTSGSTTSVDAVSMWCYYCGVCVLSLCCSLLLCLLVETPCCSLLRRLSDCAA